jgi:hypothetical protein
MAEGTALVGLQAEVPDVMGRLGQLLNLRHQKAVVQQEEQNATQRKNIAAYDWNKHLGEDGTLDVESFASDPDAPVIFGDQYADYLQKTAVAKQNQIAAKSSLMTLRTEQRKEFSDIMTALRSDKDVAEDNEVGRQKVNQEMIRFGEIYGADALPVLKAYAPGMKNVPKGRMSDALRAIGLQAADADRQIEMQKPQYTSTGRALTDINPLSAGGPREIPLSIAPGAQAEQHVDQLGNAYLVFRDPRGNIVGTQSIGGDEGGPARFGVGERDTFEKQANTNFENVTSNRQAASMAPQQLNQIDNALSLSKQVSTGAWASKRAQVESGIGSLIPGFEGFDDATKLQELDKFAERIATDASRVLGVNARTDSERESIHKQNANIGYTPQAIQAVLKYAKAQTLAMEAKGNAQEAWLSSGNKITKHHEFETEFRKAYDPRIFQFEAMTEAEQEKFAKSLSKEDRKEIAEKTRKLIELGALPGG